MVKERDERIEDKLRKGVSPNKGTQKLAAVSAWFSADPTLPLQGFPTFVSLVADFRDAHNSYSNRPGLFSNQTVQCVGHTVSRSFLAEVCDTDRLMGTISPSGISLVGIAKQELNMASSLVFEAAGKQAWIESSNLPGPTKLSKMLVDPTSNTATDWIWIELRSLPRTEVLTYRQLILTAKHRGCRAIIFYWCSCGNAMEEKVSEWTRWCRTACPDWEPSTHQVQNVHCGGPIRYTTSLLLFLPSKVCQSLGPFDDVDEPESMESYLDDSNMRYSDYISGWTLVASHGPPEDGSLSLFPVADSIISWKTDQWVVFSGFSVAPEVTNKSGDLQDYQFLLSVSDSGLRRSIRPIRDVELFRMYGFPDAFATEALSFTAAEKLTLFQDTIPKQSVSRIISVLQMAETDALQHEMETHGKAIGECAVPSDTSCYFYSRREEGQAPFSFATTKVINRWTTFPLPSLEQWQEASKTDPDISHVIEHIKTKRKVILASLLNKRYYLLWSKGQFEVEDDVLYQLEHPKAAVIRQLRRRVVPISLRQVIYTAYHASPMAGHVGFYKTYWRIAARYYWPSMYEDVRKAVTECGHCILGNNVSHQAQQILGSLSVDEPFDIIAIDIWIPGVTYSKGSFIADRSNVRQAVLTSLCNMTAFATVGFLSSLEGDVITQVLMSQVIMPNGLPKLVLLDDDSLFKQDLILLLDDMGIPFHVVSAEQHEGILCERFHRYLNKVQRLMGLDTGNHTGFMLNSSFAAYAWNAGPVDGTNVVRSFAAKARHFHFPLDVAEPVPRIIGNPGEATLQHIETTFPLWFQQKELLKYLTEDRRARHTALANKNRSKREFFPGDLVVVRRQVTSDASTGRPAKLRVRARGPYRVLEAA